MAQYTKRQAEIIEAAIDLIAEGGIQVLTIKNIASRIGISEPAIYRHFQSKLEILEAIQHFFAEEKLSFLSDLLRSEMHPIDKIIRIMEQHFSSFAAKPALASVLFCEEIFQNDRRLAQMVLRIMEHSKDTLLQIIQRGQKTKELRTDIPAEHLVTIVMGSLRFIVNKWHLQKYAFDLVKEGHLFLQSLRKIITTV